MTRANGQEEASNMRRLLYITPLLILSGCGISHKVKGGTTHTVNTQTKADVTIKIDVSACQKLPAKDQLACIEQMTSAIKDLKDVAEILICIGNSQAVSGSESVVIAESCRTLGTTPAP
jgi:hypothetical protein